MALNPIAYTEHVVRSFLRYQLTHLYGHQERVLRAIAAGCTTLASTGTGTGKTECFLYPVVDPGNAKLRELVGELIDEGLWRLLSPGG